MPPSEEPASGADLPLIGDHYQLTKKLGEGAFGEVFKAHHDLLGQDFAVKLLRNELSSDRDIQDRFLDEARALIRFSHPSIVQMRHVGRHQGRLFLVMDFIEGEELSELMLRESPFNEARSLALMKQILSGLEAAHAAGIVHRDLKPSNILVAKLPDGTDRLRILDFGLSKFSAIDGPGGAHRSITGTIVGTLAYMSPEQIKGERDIDGRSDMFAAGLILQEMLQGHHPYPGESGIVVAAKLLRDPIPPIDEDKRSKISNSTLSALARALERDRDARFASVAAFSQALEGKGPPSDTSKVTTIAEAQAELARQEAAARKDAEAKKKAAPAARPPTEAHAAPKKKTGPLVLGIVAGALALGAAGFFLLQPDDDPQPTQVGTTPDDPGKSDPGKSDPGKSDPKKDEPAKVDPKKDEPAKVDPKKDEPAKVDPKKDEPAKVDPKKDEPAKVDPKKDEPAKVDPEKDEPAKVDPKKDDPPARSPAECCDDGAKLMTAGRWAEARALYLRAAQDTKLTDDTQVRALRGAAQAWIAEANRQARTGHIDEALATYAAAGKWLDERHSAYERVERAVETARLQLGFSRLHEAETQTERARWLRVQGKAAEAAKVLKAAEINFDFALQQLQRDGVRYWEFLIRRSSMHELLGNSQAMIDDVAHTTKTNNTEVPPHMWVAHATAARRLAQAYAARGDGAQALTWAKAASKVAEDGVGWQDANLTRQQWLDLVHPLFVQATVIGTEDPTALHGKARYWIEEAAKASPAAWEHAEVTRGRMLTAAAMERYIHGLVQRRANKAAAAQVFADAEAKATEAIKAREAAAAAGGLRIDPLSFEVLAAILTVQGKTAEAQAALAKAKSTATQNPD